MPLYTSFDWYIGNRACAVNTRLFSVKPPHTITRAPRCVEKGSSWKGSNIYTDLLGWAWASPALVWLHCTCVCTLAWLFACLDQPFTQMSAFKHFTKLEWHMCTSAQPSARVKSLARLQYWCGSDSLPEIRGHGIWFSVDYRTLIWTTI